MGCSYSLRNRVSLFRMMSLVPALGICLCLLGCNSKPEIPMGTVKGKVTLGDQPYSNAKVHFLSLETGQGAGGEIQSDGTYTLAAPVPVGKYKVYLAPKPVPGASDEAPVVLDPAVPEKYWNEVDTDITVEVKEGENNIPVPLKKG